jgi:acyl-CoA reductase-like NAD-dependent aldehyde dehydrogenase
MFMSEIATEREETGTDARRELMVVDGKPVESSDGRFLQVENPARRGSVVAEVPRGGAADVDRAVRAAARAFGTWRAMPPRERGRLLLRIADDIEAELEDFARLLSTETGNALRPVARPEVRSVVDVLRYFGGLGSELKGETVPLGENMLSYTRREPYGVVGAIVPWNVPLVLSAVKIAPALLAGNTMVLKPASDAPLAILKMARIAQRHLPPGVLNVVTGTGEECGMALARHTLVAKLSFTGNTETGKQVLRAAAERVVPATLELGGKSPAIVFPDSDDEKTVDGVIAGMRFTRQGQSCTAGSRLFLHERIFDSFLGKLARKLSALRIGDPLDESTDVGAIVNRRQLERVCDYISEGMRQDGARVVVGGLPPSEGPLAKGYFAIPTVLANVRNEWRVAKEEIFGPVLVAIPWTDEDEAIRMANDTHYGLAAYVWTRDIGKAIQTAHRIESGWIQINQGLGQFPGQSYGGYKQSGIGREYSLEGMLESYTQRKSVTINLLQ